MGLRALVGLFAPLQLSAALLLRSELRRLQPGAPDLPSPCLDEFASVAILEAEMFEKGRLAQRSRVVRRMEEQAREIVLIMRPTTAPGLLEGSWTAGMLRRHGVIP